MGGDGIWFCTRWWFLAGLVDLTGVGAGNGLGTKTGGDGIWV